LRVDKLYAFVPCYASYLGHELGGIVSWREVAGFEIRELDVILAVLGADDVVPPVRRRQSPDEVDTRDATGAGYEDSLSGQA
jgi:hypothetical protein